MHLTPASPDPATHTDPGPAVVPSSTRPEPPHIDPPRIDALRGPDDLPPLHRSLVEQAAALASADTDHGDADAWATAALKVNALWDYWRHRTHATDAHEAMCTAATRAVQALLESVRVRDWREQHRWLDVATEWTNQLKMQADSRPLRHLPPPHTPEHNQAGQTRGVAARWSGWLFGQRRTPTRSSRTR